MGSAAVVIRVDERESGDTIAQRLRDLGFVAGEPVRIVARGPIGADPLLVQIGYTRFALRRAEAARVQIALGEILPAQYTEAATALSAHTEPHRLKNAAATAVPLP